MNCIEKDFDGNLKCCCLEYSKDTDVCCFLLFYYEERTETESKTWCCLFCCYTVENFKLTGCCGCCYLKDCVEPVISFNDQYFIDREIKAGDRSPGTVECTPNFTFCFPCILAGWVFNTNRCISPCWCYCDKTERFPEISDRLNVEVAQFAAQKGYTYRDITTRQMPFIKLQKASSPIRQTMTTDDIVAEYNKGS